MMAAVCGVCGLSAFTEQRSFTSGPWRTALTWAPLQVWAAGFVLCALFLCVVAVRLAASWWVAGASLCALIWLALGSSAFAEKTIGDAPISWIGVTVTILPALQTLWAVWATDHGGVFDGSTARGSSGIVAR